MAIFLERSEYLLKKNLFLFGVGLVHEDSKYTQKTFNFRYGANRTVNGERYKQQVATNDTSWTTIFYHIRSNRNLTTFLFNLRHDKKIYNIKKVP